MTGTTGMVHAGVLYSTPAQLADQLSLRVGTALAAGEPVVAVLDAANRSALVDALGADAAAVEFQDPARVHSVPAFTVAVRWARLTRRVETPGVRTTVIGQHVPDLPGCDPGYWARLDAALNVTLHGLPITMLCPCPIRGELVAQARSTHPTLLADGHSAPSASYRDPADVVAEYPPPPPPDLGPPTAELDFRSPELPAVRHLVASVSTQAGLATERIADFVLAVNEIASNSVEHGAGTGRLRLWIWATGVTCEVFDTGRMTVPFPGMVAPAPSGERGRGLWLASELSDVLQAWSDEGGTVVRLFVER
ncbi:anti-sigma factor RsbA family regulatory protein [Pseudonocardia acidicola]|uniref:Sensor histidine kinase n=1 Tax=Pseudonocardia acidicola TaxID=2724939 RepID=A0ABX1SCF0_9PSEU|nr:anti-sigma factor RsbA family regulatory protein [Pseudonocardia acidicola]NMH99251.1 sensor histidine kinase [Pseudonocardia acidicola]